MKKQNLTTKFLRIKIPDTSKSAKYTAKKLQKLQKLRVNDEIKFSYTKKDHNPTIN